MNDALVRPNERAVVQRLISEEEQKRVHLVIALSGAHAYGFPSPDSDLDLKGIHIAPTEQLLGLNPLATHADRMEVIDGVEVDYSSNELKPVLIGILQGNGNYIERVLGSLLPHVSSELDSLAPLVKNAISRRIFRHYAGFATSQLKAFQAKPPGSAKKLLYVLRTTLTGAHALHTGEIVTDLRRLHDVYGFPETRELIDAKQAGERVVLPETIAARWSEKIQRAFDLLAAAHESSALPEEPSAAAIAAIEAWHLSERKKRL